MSSPRALLATECDRQRPQQELLRELELTQLSEESLQTTIECASLVSAAVLASSAMKALEHVEEIILATTGTWSCSRSRLCRR